VSVHEKSPLSQETRGAIILSVEPVSGTGVE
jgi:hypothetical protein